MSAFEHYVSVGKKRLRCGFTTGSCAAAATLAATTLLLKNQRLNIVDFMTPGGIGLELEVVELAITPDGVRCAVIKDSGDDPDVTNGVKVYATVNKTFDNEIRITGGLGVGRVTQPGLSCAVGEAAINEVPRQMIRQAAKAVKDRAGYEGGLEITIAIPEGVNLASQTFNPRLGIVGGLSVLGTSGIVRPMSEGALIDSIEAEMKLHRAAGVQDLLVAPGNYGETFARTVLGLDTRRMIKSSNYIGDVIDRAVGLGFRSLLLIGHFGKLIKLAAGIMNTHSRYADGRAEVLVTHAALCGASRELINEVYHCPVTDGAIDLLRQTGCWNDVMASITQKIDDHLQQRGGGEILIGAMIFSNQYGVLSQTVKAAALLECQRGGKK